MSPPLMGVVVSTHAPTMFSWDSLELWPCLVATHAGGEMPRGLEGGLDLPCCCLAEALHDEEGCPF